MSPPRHSIFWRKNCRCIHCITSSNIRRNNLASALVIFSEVFGNNLGCGADVPLPRISFTVDGHTYILNGLDTPRQGLVCQINSSTAKYYAGCVTFDQLREALTELKNKK